MEIAVAIRRGQQFVEINDYSNALREHQKALEVNRNSSLAITGGELFFRQNNFQSGGNEFRAAVNGDLEPKWTEVWSHVKLGEIFDVTGQRDRAVNEYKQAIPTDDNTDVPKRRQPVILQRLTSKKTPKPSHFRMGLHCRTAP